jgi:DNA invertase Pin-like site-specific DNA recombinase
MAIFGYHRTSTTEQHLDRGVKSIEDYCKANGLVLDVLFTDQQTGKNFQRPDYQAMKRVAKANDWIICAEVDRLGRNKEATLSELNYYKSKNIRVMILELPTTLIDYSKLDNTMASMMMETINNMLIEMYATLAHAEMIKREVRQKQGIQAKKDRNEWSDYGRPAAMDYQKFKVEYAKVVTGQIKPFDLMRQLEMKKSTYYKYAKRYKQELNAGKEVTANEV